MNISDLLFKYLYFKNFMSFGNTPTEIYFNDNELTVVLGENLDTGGEDSRNGVGKSTIWEALAYVLFGSVIRATSNEKLKNKFAGKRQSMLVVVEFSKDEFDYRVERGESPSILKLFKKPRDIGNFLDKKDGNKTYTYDISRNKTETTATIVDIIGFDLCLYEYLVANSRSEDTTSFFKLKEDKKREVIEKLLGFTVLSRKGLYLKEKRKEKNKEYIAAEAAMNAVILSNKKIQIEIDSLIKKSNDWEQLKKQNIQKLMTSISIMENADADKEIKLWEELEELNENLSIANSELSTINIDKQKLEFQLLQKEKIIKDNEKLLLNYSKEIVNLQNNICPTCNQPWVNNEYKEKVVSDRQQCENINHQVDLECEKLHQDLIKFQEQQQEFKDIINTLRVEINEVKSYKFAYPSLKHALEAKSNLVMLRNQLNEINNSINPHTQSIESLRNNALQVVDENELKERKRVIEHYTLLIELLTDSDSYIRKYIIDKWLPKLNKQMLYYTTKLELPYQVKIKPDLSVFITDLNEEFDYGNLSNGERARIWIGFDLAAQDVYEIINHRINLLMFDELLDSGICNRGAENAVNLLKDIAATKHKKILVITHREDIAARIPNVIKVIKQDRKSRIDFGVDND